MLWLMIVLSGLVCVGIAIAYLLYEINRELKADAFRLYDEQREKESAVNEALDGELITASRAAEILGVSVSQIIEMRRKMKRGRQ